MLCITEFRKKDLVITMDLNEINTYIRSLCKKAKDASPALATLSSTQKNDALRAMAASVRHHRPTILNANHRDLAAAVQNKVPAPMLDRLKLDDRRLEGIAAAMEELCGLHDPIGEGECFTRPNGLLIRRMRVPLGVVAMIYEARPNVTADAAAICIKSGNACVLRGGKEAIETNRVMVAALREGLEAAGVNPNAIVLVEETTRVGAQALMHMRGLIDVLIPRGGAGLIRSVVDNARVPVIETGAGNCHMYIDESADLDMAVSLAVNAKASRPSVCNAIETLLVHEAIAPAFLPRFAEACRKYPVELRCCNHAIDILRPAGYTVYYAVEEDYSTEYDDYILAVKVVSSLEEAIAHIRRYTTQHSEAIVTRDMDHARRFQTEIDAAAVYVNASTRFTDGGEFGYGAEIGISTQKLHARGPMGLEALTTVKYLIDGNGQIR